MSAIERCLARRALRQDAGRGRRGGPAALRQGPHVLGADPDDERAGRAGALVRSAAAAVRVGLLPAVVVSLLAASGGQLRVAGARRYRAGGLPPARLVEPTAAARHRPEPA